jgi:hypothetical protein
VPKSPQLITGQYEEIPEKVKGAENRFWAFSGAIEILD